MRKAKQRERGMQATVKETREQSILTN